MKKDASLQIAASWSRIKAQRESRQQGFGFAALAGDAGRAGAGEREHAAGGGGLPAAVAWLASARAMTQSSLLTEKE